MFLDMTQAQILVSPNSRECMLASKKIYVVLTILDLGRGGQAISLIVVRGRYEEKWNRDSNTPITVSSGIFHY